MYLIDGRDLLILKGFKFGIIIQLAVGPVCLFIFNQASEKGLVIALVGVIGVAIVDLMYIMLSIWGIRSFIENKKVILKYFGSIVLVSFGIKTIVDAISSGEVRQVYIDEYSYIKSFITSIILTGSNPLTIVFWAGVFSTKVSEENLNRKDEIKFGVGAVLATLIFLSAISVIGQFTHTFLEENYISILNIIVGIFLCIFGLRLILKKEKSKNGIPLE